MGKNYDEIMQMLNKTAEITRDNSMSTAVILKKMDDQEKLLGGLAKTVNSINDDMSLMKNDIDQIKLNEEVTTDQEETIIQCAKKRIHAILGDDEMENSKYFKTFIMRLYSDTRKYAGLGSKISKTRKGDFQRCINYIEAWFPGESITELKRKTDKRAEARKQAKSLGYEV